MADKTIFQKIIDRELPSTILYEDDKYIIIKSIQPVAPIHNLVIPKKIIPSVATSTPSDIENIGGMIVLAGKFAKDNDIVNYKLIFNSGKYLHMPEHLHLHLVAGDNLPDEP